MNKKYVLSEQEKQDLLSAHRCAENLRYHDRIKAVYQLGLGRSVTLIASILMLDKETIRNYYKRYRKGGLSALMRNDAGGSKPMLTDAQLKLLSEHLAVTLYQTAKQIAAYIEDSWGVSYSESGLAQLLSRMGFVYKKPKITPGKAPSAEVQENFIAEYKALKDSNAPNDPIYFMDAVHPHHNPIAGYGWIKRGVDFKIQSNTGRNRLNINGVIDTVNLQSIVRYDDTINAQSTILLFEQIETLNPSAETISIICDNARYYKSKMVRAYLEDETINSKIKLIFLPAYSPNLNLIERYWKFFKKKVLYGKYYEKFSDFKQACDDFFSQTDLYKAGLRTLLTDNFEIVSNSKVPNFQAWRV